MTVVTERASSQITELLQEMLEWLADMHFGPIPPERPDDGDVWYNTVERRLYIYRKP